MNRDAVLFHLCEAKEQLDQTIAEMTNDPNFCLESFQVDMSHLYHHLNTAWNGRDASQEQHNASNQNDFNLWRKFPSNAELLLDN